MDRIDWRALEERIGLEDLPAFHRAFLTSRGVTDAQGMFLRRVQQAVERELNKLVQAGQATKDGDQVLVDRVVLEGVTLPDGRAVLNIS
jgi:hypothetical protein